MKLVIVALLLVAAPLRADVTAPGGLRWRTDEKTAASEAAKLKRPLLVFFSAEWCMPCKEMQRTSFADPAVAELIARRFVPLLVDMTNDDDTAHAIAERYKVRALPTLVVMQGKLERLRIESFAPPDDLRARLSR